MRATPSGSRIPIGIAYDEWNVWYRTRSHEDRVGGVEEHYDLSDALAVATYLNIFIRHCRTVRIANLAQIVNAIAPIFTSPRGCSCRRSTTRCGCTPSTCRRSRSTST